MQPFTEAWLLTDVELDGAQFWYALAHLVDWGGDVITGRETWGYPTKQAEAFHWDWHGSRVTARIVRLHRDVMVLSAETGDSRVYDPEEFEVLGIQSLGLTDTNDRGGRYVSQPWRVELADAHVIAPEHLSWVFGSKTSPPNIGLSDAWHEFSGATVHSARLGRGLVRRHPGAYRSDKLTRTILGAAVNDRNDGQRQEQTRSTFLLGEQRDSAGG